MTDRHHEKYTAKVFTLTPEEQEYLERAAAPTLRDLRAAAKEMFLTRIFAAETATPRTDTATIQPSAD
ncbi:MAG TPA: hypothetical protein VFD58_30170 [Blastocatellia bacterium]|nr:hypothetical protein [Blastocatellia bacterium]